MMAITEVLLDDARVDLMTLRAMLGMDNPDRAYWGTRNWAHRLVDDAQMVRLARASMVERAGSPDDESKPVYWRVTEFGKLLAGLDLK